MFALLERVQVNKWCRNDNPHKETGILLYCGVAVIWTLRCTPTQLSNAPSVPIWGLLNDISDFHLQYSLAGAVIKTNNQALFWTLVGVHQGRNFVSGALVRARCPPEENLAPHEKARAIPSPKAVHLTRKENECFVALYLKKKDGNLFSLFMIWWGSGRKLWGGDLDRPTTSWRARFSSVFFLYFQFSA